VGLVQAGVRRRQFLGSSIAALAAVNDVFGGEAAGSDVDQG
jgi:hypothetical protein